MKKTNKTTNSTHTPTKYTAFRCPVDILEKAKAAAKAERRSLSNYIITLLEAKVK